MKNFCDLCASVAISPASLLDEAGRRLGRHFQMRHEPVQLLVDLGELSLGPLMVRHDCFIQS